MVPGTWQVRLTFCFGITVSTADARSFTTRCLDVAKAMKSSDASSRGQGNLPWPSFKTELEKAKKRTKGGNLTYPRCVRYGFLRHQRLTDRMTSSAEEEAALKVALQRKLRCMPNVKKAAMHDRDEFRTWANETLGIKVTLEKPRAPPDPSRLVLVKLKDLESCREPSIAKVQWGFSVWFVRQDAVDLVGRWVTKLCQWLGCSLTVCCRLSQRPQAFTKQTRRASSWLAARGWTHKQASQSRWFVSGLAA